MTITNENIITTTAMEIASQRQAMIDRLIKQAQELDATEDANGRFHAPTGGCFFEGKFYVGGEYLPFSLSGAISQNFPSNNGKALIELNDFAMFQNLLKDYSDVSHGKTWERNGKTFCYIYFNGIQPSKMVRAIEKFYTDKQAQEPKKVVGKSPEGKVEVVGTVLAFKSVEGFYGYTTKMLVELENGSKVFGTAPKGDYGQGDKIVFKGDFSVKEHGFSFFKRPKFMGKA